MDHGFYLLYDQCKAWSAFGNELASPQNYGTVRVRVFGVRRVMKHFNGISGTWQSLTAPKLDDMARLKWTATWTCHLIGSAFRLSGKVRKGMVDFDWTAG